MPFDSLPRAAHRSPTAILLQVRDAIAAPNSWCQGALHDPVSGRRCLLGWLKHFGGQTTAADVALVALADAIGGNRHIPEFNDRKGTHKVHVLQVIDHAIAISSR
jgi:hypothetical protein